MATHVTANSNAKKEFEIPVSWQVFDKVKVQANSLKEAYDYVKENIDLIPLGTEPEYVESSYEITGSMEECSFYQPVDDVVCIEYECSDDLSQYVDSMLFDSYSDGGDSIATGIFAFGNKTIMIELNVCGDVAVTFKNEVYHKPSMFPNELVEQIKAHPNTWAIYVSSVEDNDETEGHILVGSNNWFEYTITTTDYSKVYEGSLSKATAEDILDDMQEIARQYFEVSKS